LPSVAKFHMSVAVIRWSTTKRTLSITLFASFCSKKARLWWLRQLRRPPKKFNIQREIAVRFFFHAADLTMRWCNVNAETRSTGGRGKRTMCPPRLVRWLWRWTRKRKHGSRRVPKLSIIGQTIYGGHRFGILESTNSWFEARSFSGHRTQSSAHWILYLLVSPIETICFAQY